ncbi:MAG: hypothetical protein Q8O88_01445 [bacterium]|nr:hypothetical protein [bacterium]
MNKIILNSTVRVKKEYQDLYTVFNGQIGVVIAQSASPTIAAGALTVSKFLALK